MKTLAQQNAVPEKGSVLDTGCGTGVIAVSLKKKFPKLDVTASDRNALALRFTSMNAELNGIDKNGFQTASGLLPGSLKRPVDCAPEKWDLIISNIPAKAGKPVIKDFLQNCGHHLADGGKVAVVIVQPLADFAENCLSESGAAITHKEADKQYSVYHFKPGKAAGVSTFASVYERTDDKITGFYGLPEFDSLSYRSQVTLEILNGYHCGGKTLLWNPGIGHIPAACSYADELITAGEDLLQLKASDFNAAAGYPHHHLPVFRDLSSVIKDELDYIVAVPDFITGAAVEEEVLSTSLNLLKSRGKLLASGKSSDIARIEKSRKGYILKHSVKYRGFRALLLEKQ